jgi:hypothetical protein
MSNNGLGYQQKLTVLFVIGYFAMIFVFLGCGGALFLLEEHFQLSPAAEAVMQWIMATLGPLIGVLTGSLKDQLQFHYGSSAGSKMKDARGVAPSPIEGRK